VYAFYAHLKPGSVAVKVGDKLKRGQVLAQLGNSGNTSEAHLHFQLMRGQAPLSSDNVPFEIDRFDMGGSVDLSGVVNVPPAGPRSNELPLIYSLTTYPPAPPS
jgi:murein DD-endopeptidase MepM/ murein hydrolase activator NlpD